MKASYTRIATGVIIALVGFGLLAGNLNLFDANIHELWRTWWPLLVIVAAVLIFINDTKSYIWAFLVAVFGVLFQLKNLEIITANPWQVFWPMVIVAVGFSIAFESSRHRKYEVSKKDRDEVVAVLGGSNKQYTSDNYLGTSTTVVMGGNKIDLRKVHIKEQAIVSTTVIMGGLEVIVPRNIQVRNETNAILGGVEDKTDQEKVKDAPLLVITGDVIMGGISIRNS